METPVHVICYLGVRAAVPSSTPAAAAAAADCTIHTQPADSSQQYCCRWLAPATDLAFLPLIQLENVEVAMRSSAGAGMTAGEKANANNATSSARKTYSYQPTTYLLHATYVQQHYVLISYVPTSRAMCCCCCSFAFKSFFSTSWKICRKHVKFTIP